MNVVVSFEVWLSFWESLKGEQENRLLQDLERGKRCKRRFLLEDLSGLLC